MNHVNQYDFTSFILVYMSLVSNDVKVAQYLKNSKLNGNGNYGLKVLKAALVAPVLYPTIA